MLEALGETVPDRLRLRSPATGQGSERSGAPAEPSRYEFQQYSQNSKKDFMVFQDHVGETSQIRPT